MTRFRIFSRQYDEGKKCESCGWYTEMLYVVAKDKMEADKFFNEGFGLCSSCLLEMLMSDGYALCIETIETKENGHE